MSTALAYDRSSVLSDYMRAGLGLAACGLPLLFTDPMPWLSWVLAVTFVLFLVFTLRSVFRHFCRFRLDDTGFERLSPWPRRVDWAEISGLKLRYYTTRRTRDQSRDGGWFQLQLRGNKGKIIIDSNLSNFDQVLKASARAAGERGLALDQATRDNLSALGVATYSPEKNPG